MSELAFDLAGETRAAASAIYFVRRVEAAAMLANFGWRTHHLLVVFVDSGCQLTGDPTPPRPDLGSTSWGEDGYRRAREDRLAVAG